ncbi:MAG: HAMP domain-containing protein, partial [Candidatus Eisenbacteria bacterium]|nr:HAMP domain-containing protein [Candidatus Eisenbacteria bacterium]
SASFLFPGRGDQVYKMGFAPVIRDGIPQAVIIAEGNAGFLASAGRMRQVLISVGLVALLLGALAAWGLASSVTSPLRRMAQAARLIGGGDLESPVSTAGPGEVGELGRVLEGMRRDLQHRDQQLRLMVAGVAHEIRNPLGGLVLYADLLGQDPTLSEEGRAQAAKILREANILERIVEEFNIFARPSVPELESIRMAILWEEVRPLVEGRMVEERSAAPPAIKWVEEWEADEFSADRRQLRQILLNLALNAAEALGAAGGIIRVRSRRAAGEIVLEVEDSGPGVDPSKYEEALEPFVTTKARGAGLGLPMVQRLARAHGGSVALDRSDLGGLAVRVRLPQDGDADSRE